MINPPFQDPCAITAQSPEEWEALYRSRIATCKFQTNGVECLNDCYVETHPSYTGKTSNFCQYHTKNFTCENVFNNFFLSRHQKCSNEIKYGEKFCPSCRCSYTGCSELVIQHNSISSTFSCLDRFCRQHSQLEGLLDCRDALIQSVVDNVRNRALNLITDYQQGKTVSTPFRFIEMWDEESYGVEWLKHEIKLFNLLFGKLYPEAVFNFNPKDYFTVEELVYSLKATTTNRYVNWLYIFSNYGGFNCKYYQSVNTPKSLLEHFQKEVEKQSLNLLICQSNID